MQKNTGSAHGVQLYIVLPQVLYDWEQMDTAITGCFFPGAVPSSLQPRWNMFILSHIGPMNMWCLQQLLQLLAARSPYR